MLDFAQNSMMKGIASPADLVMDKVDVSKIRLRRIDGISGNANVTSMVMADMVVRGWRDTIPHGRHLSFEVEIVFEDGHSYEAVYPMQVRVTKRQSFSIHVREFLELLVKGESKALSSQANNLLSNYCI